MGMTLVSILFAVLLLSSPFPHVRAAYSEGEEQRYLADFPSLISGSYSVPRPAELAVCVNSAQAPNPLPQATVTTNSNAAQLQSTCGTGTLCIIQAGVTVTLNGNVNVAALINRGTIIWTDATQTQARQYLCGGYIITEANGIFNLSVTSTSKTAYIYIKDNGAIHSNPGVGSRAFGGSQTGATIQGYPLVYVTGAPKRRTWSLLATTGFAGDNTIKLQHDVAAMGWQVGDRIALAPTVRQSQGVGQWFYIQAINGNRITLASDTSSALNVPGYLSQTYLGDIKSRMQAEVLMLTRNVIITGDDFKQRPCGDSVCPCRFTGEVCTVGLHTLVAGNNVRFGGTYRIQYTRVEKCGQRGVIGRYCIHFHIMRDCPDCLARGNTVEFSHQRGIIVHGTHLSTVSENTLYDVRGAGIYIEDGNELYNYINYNAVTCPHAFDGPKQGCTIPGTDNGDADTANNHAAYWSLSHTNHFIGNRATNAFNGIFFDPTFAPGGRGFAQGQVCVVYTPLGRVEGNTCHGHGRFGMYFVASDFPRSIGTNLSMNGYTTEAMCAPWDAQGLDRGLPGSIWNNVDYHSTFVGSYSLGDIQYRNHWSISNLNLVYHKETKNFRDGCSSHYKNYHFEDGAALVAGGWGTQIFEDSQFVGSFSFETDHHCSLNIGALCNPQYIFLNPLWQVTSNKFLTWNDGNNPTHGAVYNLAPPNAANPNGIMFPAGFQGACHGIHTYLLALDGGATCVTAASLGLASQWENGILCRKPLRRFEIYTSGLTAGNAGTVQLQVSRNNAVVSTGTMYFLLNGNKQGFTIPIISSLDYNYRVIRSGGIPAGWIIEFSDTVMGNRWAADQIRLTVDGRTCPPITTSQHDRRFIYSSDTSCFQVSGRGACSGFPDMPAVSCASVPDIKQMECPGQCGANCNGPNQYCDCGSQKCMCTSGFSGPNCQTDICASSRCSANGECTARYLGGDLPVTAGACRCKEPFTGSTCSLNPCAGVSCGAHGTCKARGPSNYVCECAAGWNGPACDRSCTGFCTANNGQYPFNCATGRGAPSFCSNFGGCGYTNDLFQQSAWCCYESCDACIGVVCPTPDNDCMQPGVCVNGACGAPQRVPDGTACHSVVWGVCNQGVCTASGTTPAPTTPAPTTPAPNTPAPATPAPPTTPPGSVQPPAAGYLRSKSNGLYVTLAATQILTATEATTATAALFSFGAITGGYSIQAQSNLQFVCAENYGDSALIANRPVADGWEIFTFYQSTSYYAFAAIVNNKYVAIQTANGNQLLASVPTGGTIPDIALFTIVPPPPPTVAPTVGANVKIVSRSANLYLTVGADTILTASGSVTTAATFNIAAITGGNSLRYVASNLYVCADNYGAAPLIANRPVADGWETFVFVAKGNGAYAIQATANGLYVAVQSNGQVVATVATTGTTPNTALFSLTSA